MPVANKASLSFVTNNAHAFRSALIIASLHFVWNKGDLQQFKSTFLVHKVHSIRMVNEWMATKDSSLFTSIVRQVATLCFSEVSRSIFPTVALKH